MTVLVVEATKKARPTDEEIAAKRAAKLAKREPVKTHKQLLEEIIKDLGAEAFVDLEPDGRILVNGNTVFFTHYRNERTPSRWIVRHPETAYLKDNRAITMAYYFPNENEVHAAIIVKSEGDQYYRRAGNRKAFERLLKGEASNCVAVEATAISGFISVMESTEVRIKNLAELLAPQVREATIEELVKGLAGTHPKNLSHYAVQDALVEAFIQADLEGTLKDRNGNSGLLLNALVLPELPTGDVASNDA